MRNSTLADSKSISGSKLGTSLKLTVWAARIILLSISIRIRRYEYASERVGSGLNFNSLIRLTRRSGLRRVKSTTDLRDPLNTR